MSTIRLQARVNPERDPEIASWWDSLGDGERSGALLEVVRAGLGIVRPASAPPVTQPDLEDALYQLSAHLITNFERALNEAFSQAVFVDPFFAAPAKNYTEPTANLDAALAAMAKGVEEY